MRFTEDIPGAESYREEFFKGFEELLNTYQEAGKRARDEFCRDLFTDPERYRAHFRAMLGRPLTESSPKEPPRVVRDVLLSEEDGYTVRRMSFEILPGLVMTGLLFRLDGKSGKPLVIVQHGGLGTPELISGLYPRGTGNYNDIVTRTLKKGVHAFAPQLLIWNNECCETKFDRARLDARLKRVGSSITAVEVYGITRILDHFETQDYVSTFGMIGLSYGGFYTLFTAAADTRIRSAIACSQFNSRDAYDWPDWTWFDAAYTFSDAEIACLVYPRHLCLEVGINDELFDVKRADEEFSRLQKLAAPVGTDWVDYIRFDGTHEYCKDDAPVERLVNDLL